MFDSEERRGGKKEGRLNEGGKQNNVEKKKKGSTTGTSSSVVVYGLIRFAWRQAICCGSLSYILLSCVSKRRCRPKKRKKNKYFGGGSVILFNRICSPKFFLSCVFSYLVHHGFLFSFLVESDVWNGHKIIYTSHCPTHSLVGTAPFEPAPAASFKNFRGGVSRNPLTTGERERERVELLK